MTEDLVYLQLFVLMGAVVQLAFMGTRRGQRLWDEVARRFPEVYEELGRPRPGLIDTVHWHRHYKVLAYRQYDTFDDAEIVARFERLRRYTYRTAFLLIGGLVYIEIALHFFVEP